MAKKRRTILTVSLLKRMTISHETKEMIEKKCRTKKRAARNKEKQVMHTTDKKKSISNSQLTEILHNPPHTHTLNMPHDCIFPLARVKRPEPPDNATLTPNRWKCIKLKMKIYLHIYDYGYAIVAMLADVTTHLALQNLILGRRERASIQNAVKFSGRNFQFSKASTVNRIFIDVWFSYTAVHRPFWKTYRIKVKMVVYFCGNFSFGFSFIRPKVLSLLL